MRIHTRRLTAQTLAVAFTSLALFSSAHATEKGWYLGFGIGQSELDDNDTFSDICDELFVVCGDKSSGTAFKAIVGYQINNYIGVEGAYFDLGSPSLSTDAPIVVDASAGMSRGSFSVLPQIPIGKIGAIFGKLRTFLFEHIFYLTVFPNLRLELPKKEAKSHIGNYHIMLDISNE